jgi:hypothetical protein
LKAGREKIEREEIEGQIARICGCLNGVKIVREVRIARFEEGREGKQFWDDREGMFRNENGK